MRAKTTIKAYKEELSEYKKRYLKQKQFPPLPNPYKTQLQPIMHTGYLMFIRNKFLYLGLLSSLENRNMFACFSLLKAYWENVATFGYYYLTVSSLLNDNREEEAFIISRQMGLGGRGFLTEDMVKNKGRSLQDFTIPKISKMMRIVDEDWKKTLGDNSSLFKEFYDTYIAEAGHTTYSGLSISGKWLPNKALLPDLRKSWNREEHLPLLNYLSISTIVFFFYWEKFIKSASAFTASSINPKRL